VEHQRITHGPHGVESHRAHVAGLLWHACADDRPAVPALTLSAVVSRRRGGVVQDDHANDLGGVGIGMKESDDPLRAFVNGRIAHKKPLNSLRLFNKENSGWPLESVPLRHENYNGYRLI